MPRPKRILVQGIPVHIVQRGHNRNPVFRCDDDFRFYLRNLLKAKSELGVQLLAYCLMTNHVHLILLPPADVMRISRLMQVVAGRQTAWVNQRHSRTGSLWESRFKSSCIETGKYLLACYRYVELNPVRAGMVQWPDQYPWSSYRVHIGLDSAPALDEHAEYAALGSTTEERERAYRKIVEANGGQLLERFIRKSTQRSQLIGSKRFSEELKKGVRPL